MRYCRNEHGSTGPSRKTKSPADWRGWYSGAKQLCFQFPSQYSSKADQTSSDQGQAAGFRHDNVGIAARNRGGAIEEADAGIDRQLEGGTIYRALSFPGTGN